MSRYLDIKCMPAHRFVFAWRVPLRTDLFKASHRHIHTIELFTASLESPHSPAVKGSDTLIFSRTSGSLFFTRRTIFTDSSSKSLSISSGSGGNTGSKFFWATVSWADSTAFTEHKRARRKSLNNKEERKAWRRIIHPECELCREKSGEKAEKKFHGCLFFTLVACLSSPLFL